MHALDVELALRIIPAQAGNTRRRCPRFRGRTDHPRAGGEHKNSAPGTALSTGSSPRRRGTRTVVEFGTARRRIIPAQAGNTVHEAPVDLVFSDHPRAGGEHTRFTGAARTRAGSSPRRRGTPDAVCSRSTTKRIIPAQAGNTASASVSELRVTDHPRAGGEHWVSQPMKWSAFGSSPRRRGTRTPARPPVSGRRIIPAQAGNTAAIRSPARTPPDHPRAGGEHWPPPIVAAKTSGSSPRRRGTRTLGRQDSREARIIPAQAGNTPKRARFHSSEPDHPRAGGEHYKVAMAL